MQYSTYAPSELLSSYVKYYWTLEDVRDSSLARERIFPDGCMELIFHYGDPFSKYYNENATLKQPRSFIHGQLHSFMDVQANGKIGLFSIRFMPQGLHSFLKMSADDLTDHAVPVQEIWGNDGLLLEEKIMEAKSTRQRIQIVEDFLLRHLIVRRSGNDEINYCVRTILNSTELIAIEKLSSEVNMGRRHLERKFIDAVGLSPKLFARISRFQSVLNLIEKNKTSSLTTIAYATGFYDQSHFIKDFKEFTGLNPKHYFKEDLEFAKYLSSQ